MVLQSIQPARELAPYIKSYWYLKNDHSIEALQTIVPNGLMGLCFYRSGALEYSGMGRYRTGLGGQRLKSLNIQSGNVEAIGVEFMPYGAKRFFPVSSLDFFDLVCTPLDISDKELITLEEEILSAPEADQCWSLLNRFFLSRMKSVEANELNFKRIQAALGTPNATVESMAATANLSPKQFRRIFSEYVGIMPKGYLRLARHQKTMTHLLQACRQPDAISNLEELSWVCGYYGASHLITDFKDIMGYTPLDLLRSHAPESYSWVDVESTSLMNENRNNHE